MGTLSAARGADTWADPTTGGEWTTAGNWTNGVPTSGEDTFITGTPTPITVNLDGSVGNGSAQSLTLDGADLELINATTLTVGQTVHVGGAGNGSLDINQGTAAVLGQVTIQGSAGTFNFVDVFGSLNMGAGIVTVGSAAGDSDHFNIFSTGTINLGGAVVNATGSIIFDNNTTLNFSGSISGAGTLVLQNGGTIILSGDGSGFHGTFTFQHGIADVTNAGYLANASLFDFTNSGFDDQLKVEVSATTSSTSVINVRNNPNVSSIAVESGITFIHAGSLTGVPGGILVINPSSSPGATGTMRLTGQSTAFTGVLEAEGGFLEIANGAVIGDNANAGLIADAGSLVQINGTMNLGTTQVAGGDLRVEGTLTSLNPVQVVNGGILSGYGTIDGTTSVTVGGNSLQPGGTIEPGIPVAFNTPFIGAGQVGRLTITGGLILNSDATTIMKVAGTVHGNNPALLPGGDYDELTISGTAQLAGTLVVQAGAGVVQAGDKFDFISATGGINGTFQTVNILNNALSYTQSVENAGTTYVLTLQAQQQSFVPFAQTPNQAAIASALDTQYANLGNTDIITALDNIPGNALPDALEQMSPQPLQVLGHIAFDNASFNSQQLNNHLANLRDGLTGFDGSQLTVTDASLSAPLSQIKGRLLAWNPASTPGLMSDIANPIFGAADSSRDRFSTFIAGNVVLADLSHNADLAHQDYTTGTVSVGGDYRLDRHWTLGGMFSYAHTDASLDHIGSKATVDSYSPALYASYVNGGWYANALFAYGFNDYSEQRNVNFGAGIPGVRGGLIDGSNQADSNGNQFTGNVTGGYEFQHGGWKFGPVASAQYVNLGINSFQETGPTALNIDRQDAESLRTQVGLEARYAVNVGSIYLTPHASVSWQHEFLDDSRGIPSAFNGTGAGSFTVATSSPDRDSAFINVGLNAELTHSVTLFTDYTTQAGQADFFAQSVQAGLKIAF